MLFKYYLFAVFVCAEHITIPTCIYTNKCFGMCEKNFLFCIQFIFVMDLLHSLYLFKHSLSHRIGFVIRLHEMNSIAIKRRSLRS